MKSQNTKSSDELHKEVRKEIRNVNRDLGEIQGRLSPGQLIDDAIFYPHGRNLGATLDHLKRNPVGTAFLSLGTILLMEDESHNTYESNARSKFSSGKAELSSKASSLKGNVKSHLPFQGQSSESGSSKGEMLKEKASEVKEGIQSKAEEIKGTVQSKASEMKEGLQSKQEELKTGLNSQIEDAKAAFGGMEESGAEYQESQKQNLKGKVSTMINSGKQKAQNVDPMAYMALGAGLGAITGASLPVSDKEKNLVQDKLGEKFSTLNKDLQDAINESTNILKDLVIQDVKDVNFKVFKS